MNKGNSANLKDRIEFLIALMTKNYIKACDVGDRLSKCDPKDENVIRVLNILKQKRQYEMNACGRSSSIGGPIVTDDECEEASDVNNGEDADSVEDNINGINPRTTSQSIPHTFRCSNDERKINLEFKKKMHRVISIKLNRKMENTQINIPSKL